MPAWTAGTSRVLVAGWIALSAAPDSASARVAGAADPRDVRLSEISVVRQGEPALAVRDDGSCVAAWVARDPADGSRGVYVREVLASGVEVGSSERRVDEDRDEIPEAPAVAVSGDRALVAWVARARPDRSGAVRARVGEATVTLSSPEDVNPGRVALESLPTGDWVAAWETGPTASRCIAIRILDADGVPVGAPTLPAAPVGTANRHPAVARGLDGGFVVAWARSTGEGEPLGVLAQRFDRTGTPVGESIRVSGPDQAGLEPAVASNDDGAFAVAYLALGDRPYHDVWLRRYRSSGVPASDPFPAASRPDGAESAVAVTMAPAGDLAVVWTRASARSQDVLVRSFDSAGRARAPERPATAATAGAQSLAARGTRRTALGPDGLRLVWQGAGDDARKAVHLTLPGSPAPDASSAPTAAPAASPHQPPTRTGEPLPPLAIRADARATAGGISFTGFLDTGWDPPDPHIAVGPNDLVVCVNGGLSGRGRDGTLLWQFPIAGLGGFWAPKGAGTFVFDPEVIYDPHANRFFVVANERHAGGSYLLLGVSSTQNAADPWYKYRFDVTSLGGPDIDSPSIGVDANVLYLTADFLTPGDNILFYMIDKASILTGGTAVRTALMHNGTKSFGVPTMYTSDAPGMYFPEALTGPVENQVVFWTVDDPLGTPSLQSVSVPVPTYHPPVRIPCQGTSSTVYVNGARFWSTMYRDGSVWAAQHIGTDTTATARTVVRWDEFEMNGWPTSGSSPTLRQTGTLDLGPGVFSSFSSISTDPAGNTAMVLARSAADEFFSIVRAYRTAADPLGQMGNLVTVITGDSPQPGTRWGDYSGIVADPTVPGAFWYHHELAEGGAWRTLVEQFSVGAAVAAPEVAAAPPVRVEVAPSPTRGATRIAFSAPADGRATVEILSVEGRLVARLPADTAPGARGEVHWDGRARDGRPVPAGIYFARVTAGDRLVGARRIVVVR